MGDCLGDAPGHGATCGLCGAGVALDRSDARFAKVRGELVKLAGGTRALEYRLLGACRECGGSLVRVALDDRPSAPPAPPATP